MKIVVALDSFKGSLTAVQACDIVAEAIRSAVPGAQVVTKPMADGGEGTASVLMAAAGGRWIGKTVMGPLPEMQVEASFVWLPGSEDAGQVPGQKGGSVKAEGLGERSLRGEGVPPLCREAILALPRQAPTCPRDPECEGRMLPPRENKGGTPSPQAHGQTSLPVPPGASVQHAAALVEMATASGLPLLKPQQRNPLQTTTYGTGQLIQAAIDHGAKHILLAIGGSATVDGGVGAAMALGWKFLAQDGQEIGFGGGQLARIARIVAPVRGVPEGAFSNRGVPPMLVRGSHGQDARGTHGQDGRATHGRDAHATVTPHGVTTDVTIEVLCDVDNPLCGEHGAARVYGPQKGATPEMVEQLDAGLAHLARLVKDQLGCDIACLPGAGAAGGLAAGAVAFMGARLVPGIEAVMSQTRLREAVADADWVITGEGSFDEQSLRGKVVSGVVRVARAAGARVAVCAGQVRLEPEKYRHAGIEAAVACMKPGMELDYAIAHSAELLDCAARRFARDYLCEKETSP